MARLTAEFSAAFSRGAWRRPDRLTARRDHSGHVSVYARSCSFHALSAAGASSLPYSYIVSLGKSISSFQYTHVRLRSSLT